MRYCRLGSWMVSLLILTGCVVTPNERIDSNPVTWGNYKCKSHSSSGMDYLGWATNENVARSNALKICRAHEASATCVVVSCKNEIKQSMMP